MDLFQSPFKIAAQGRQIHVHHRGQTVKAFIGLWQRVCLRVADHLYPVLDGAMCAVMVAKGFGRVCGDPFLIGQHSHAFAGAAHPQVRVAPTRYQLAGLGKELDLADAAAPELHIAA